jgi:hypothetical protein
VSEDALIAVEHGVTIPISWCTMQGFMFLAFRMVSTIMMIEEHWSYRRVWPWESLAKGAVM